MTMTAISCLQITVRLGRRVDVRAGNTPQEAEAGLFRTANEVSRDVIREILRKVLAAYEGGDASINLNVPNPDGVTIQRDLNFPLPPNGGAAGSSARAASLESATVVALRTDDENVGLDPKATEHSFGLAINLIRSIISNLPPDTPTDETPPDVAPDEDPSPKPKPQPKRSAKARKKKPKPEE
jgi:hypothetical protein